MPKSQATTVITSETFEAECPCGVGRVYASKRQIEVWRRLHTKCCVIAQKSWGKKSYEEIIRVRLEDCCSKQVITTNKYPDGTRDRTTAKL